MSITQPANQHGQELKLSVNEDSSEENVEQQKSLPVPWSQNPKNPQNWSMWKKVLHTAIPCILNFVITFSTSVTVPATPFIAAEFGVSRTESLLALTLYTAGLALGPLFIAPLSEIFGRKWVYVATVTCFVAFTGASGGAPDFAGLLVFRCLAGILGSAGIAMGAGTVADIWALGTEGGTAGLFFILGPFLGPTLGPLASAYILSDHGNDWRWTQWLSLMIVAPVWIGAILMKETSKVRLDPQPPTTTAAAIDSTRSKLRQLRIVLRTGLLRPFKMLFTEVIVFSLTIYTAFAYAMIFSYFASASYVLPLYYGFDSHQVGLSFISIIIGYLLAALMFAVFDKTLYARAYRLADGQQVMPEHRLYTALVGSIFLPISLFWYAWEARSGGNWAALVASGIPLGLGAFSLFLSTITYMVDVYQAKAAASALAANGLLRYLLGAVFPLFTVQMYQNLGVHWAGTVFACLSLLLLPIPWLLFKYGHLLRERDSSIAKAAEAISQSSV